jgi:hypothetical protein
MKKIIVFLMNIIQVIAVENVISNSGQLFENSLKKSIDKYGYVISDNDSEDFELNEIIPRIFSPNEGNKVRFSFSNPNFSEVTIKIFDITGAEIKRNLQREEEGVMFWDGTDENDNLVRAGIYIYQLEADGKVINGTIIVAR